MTAAQAVPFLRFINLAPLPLDRASRGKTRRPQVEDCHIYGKELHKVAEYVDSVS
jgi:hypothetical protein